MNYDWYLIFNLAEFNALDLPSRTYTLNLEGLGEREVMVTKGNTVGIYYDEVFLALNLNNENPFEFDGHAIFHDMVSDNVYLGIAADES